MKIILWGIIFLIITSVNSFALDQQEAINIYFKNKKLEPIEGIYSYQYTAGSGGTFILYKEKDEYLIRSIKPVDRFFKKSYTKTGDIIGVYKKNENQFVGKCFEYESSFFDNVFSLNKEVKKITHHSILYYSYRQLQQYCFKIHYLDKIYPLISVDAKDSEATKNKTKEVYIDPFGEFENEKSYSDYWWALILIAAVIFFIYTQTGKELKITNRFIKKKLISIKEKKTKKINRKENFKDYLG